MSKTGDPKKVRWKFAFIQGELYAIGFSIASGRRLSDYVESIFPPYPSSLGRGDPG
jgi:hypothetical protein